MLGNRVCTGEKENKKQKKNSNACTPQPGPLTLYPALPFISLSSSPFLSTIYILTCPPSILTFKAVLCLFCSLLDL